MSKGLQLLFAVVLRAPSSAMRDSPPTAFSPYPPIHIIVKNGHLDLEGVVRSQTEKDTVFIGASGVSGVFSKDNNLHVEQPPKS